MSSTLSDGEYSTCIAELRNEIHRQNQLRRSKQNECNTIRINIERNVEEHRRNEHFIPVRTDNNRRTIGYNQSWSPSESQRYDYNNRRQPNPYGSIQQSPNINDNRQQNYLYPYSSKYPPRRDNFDELRQREKQAEEIRRREEEKHREEAQRERERQAQEIRRWEEQKRRELQRERQEQERRRWEEQYRRQEQERKRNRQEQEARRLQEDLLRKMEEKDFFKRFTPKIKLPVLPPGFPFPPKCKRIPDVPGLKFPEGNIIIQGSSYKPLKTTKIHETYLCSDPRYKEEFYLAKTIITQYSEDGINNINNNNVVGNYFDKNKQPMDWEPDVRMEFTQG